MLRAAFGIAVLVAACSVSDAQDGTGRSGSGVRSVPARSLRVASRVRPPKRAPASVPAVPVRRVELGRLILSVNEPGTQAEIVRTGEPRRDLISVPGRSAGSLTRTLTAGEYTVTVRKAGYSDEVRRVEIADGRPARVAMFLRPVTAFLSVRPSVPDAMIEIERLGTYQRPLQRHPVAPGIYRVMVSKRGYLTREIRVDLARPGREEVLNVVLKPLRVDAVLALAAEHLRKGEAAQARQLADDVLQLNPSHGRANLIRGMAAYERGDRKAAADLINAVRRGETVLLQVKVRDPEGRLTSVELGVEREAFMFRSTVRPEWNFRIPRAGITRLDRGNAPGAEPLIALSGNAQFHGRPINPDLTVFSVGASGPDGQPRCVPMLAERTCTSDIDIIFELLSAVRSGKAE